MFPIGHIVATPGVLAFLKEQQINPLYIFVRHVTRDWSEMDREDQRLNELAVYEGTRIVSGYMYRGKRLLVITEADRSITTLLLAEEY